MGAINDIFNPPSMQSYGCTICQQHHYSDTPEFEAHIGWQSKHGIRTVPAYVVADERESRQRWDASRE